MLKINFTTRKEAQSFKKMKKRENVILLISITVNLSSLKILFKLNLENPSISISMNFKILRFYGALGRSTSGGYLFESRVFEPAGSRTRGSVIQIHVADLVAQEKSCYP